MKNYERHTLLLVVLALFISLSICGQSVSGIAKTYQQLINPKFGYGEAILKGKITGYTPNEKDRIEIANGDLITGSSQWHYFKIANDGSFECKIPFVSSIEEVRFYSLGIDERIHLSSGEETLLFIDLNKKEQAKEDKNIQYVYFEGANAEINNELFHKVHGKISFDNPAFEEKFKEDIKGMTPIQYRDYLYAFENEKINEIGSLNISPELKETLNHRIKHITVINLVMGDMMLERASESESYEAPDFNNEYYSILKNLPLERMTLDYASIGIDYLSRFDKLIEIFAMPIYQKDYDEMMEIGLVSPADMEVVEWLRATECTETNPKIVQEDLTSNIKTLETLKEANLLKGNKLHIANRLCNITDIKTDKEYEYYSNLVINFMYPEVITDSIYNSLKLNPVQFPSLIRDAETQNKINKKKKLKEEDPELANKIEVFKATNMFFLENYRRLNFLDLKLEMYRKISGFNGKLFSDLMFTQTLSKRFEEMKPFTDADFALIKHRLDNPFFVEHLTRKNDELLAKIEKDKKNIYNVHNAPQMEEDKILHEIMKPYQGKVIFIDFWNTWCGPCRQAIKEFAPARDSYKGKDIVFIYLADESSPEKQWNNMIPSIGGEHYRLSREQMAYLKKKFNFTGIPFYMIFSKKGEQVHADYKFRKETLDEELSK